MPDLRSEKRGVWVFVCGREGKEECKYTLAFLSPHTHIHTLACCMRLLK